MSSNYWQKCPPSSSIESVISVCHFLSSASPGLRGPGNWDVRLGWKNVRVYSFGATLGPHPASLSVAHRPVLTHPRSTALLVFIEHFICRWRAERSTWSRVTQQLDSGHWRLLRGWARPGGLGAARLGLDRARPGLCEQFSSVHTVWSGDTGHSQQ